MKSTIFDMERSIARCRAIFSAIAILTIYVDPTQPKLTRWLPLTGGLFAMDPYVRTVMFSHLAYSTAIYLVLVRRIAPPRRVALISTWTDVLFGAAIVLVTEGTTSAFSAFFAFAVLTAGLREGMRATLVVTAVSVTLYLGVILAFAPASETPFIVMRPAYLAIMGYLVGYLGEARLNQEARIHELEFNAQRERIARSLHDGYAQALAGVNLRLETCRELYRRGEHAEMLAELTDLQAGVNREHDELRTYIRSLVDLDAFPATPERDDGTQFSVSADFRGSGTFVEHVLHIILEGARNVRRHARARSARITVANGGDGLVLTIDDDGVGFPDDAGPPWSIASRVAEFGGELSVAAGHVPGAHLRIRLPEA